MKAAEIIQLIGTIISAGTLVVSVVVFLSTIIKTEKEKKQNLAQEKFNSFLKAIGDFFQLIDPQKYYDNFSTIYGRDPLDYAEKYAEIKRFNSSIFYQSHVIRIYTPNESKSAAIIIDLLARIEKDAVTLNDIFCKDILSKYNNTNQDINVKEVVRMQDEYRQCYERIVEFVFRGLHVTRDSIVYGSDAIEEYEKEFISKYKQ